MVMVKFIDKLFISTAGDAGKIKHMAATISFAVSLGHFVRLGEVAFSFLGQKSPIELLVRFVIGLFPTASWWANSHIIN